jgi:hypothetical protein
MLAAGFPGARLGRYSEQVLFLLLFGGAAFLIAGTLAVVFAPRPWLVLTLVAGGPVLAATWFLVAYWQAPTARPRGDRCADCSVSLGRWWELGFFVLVLCVNVVAWWLGAAVGAGLRWAVQRSGRTRPTAA